MRWAVLLMLLPLAAPAQGVDALDPAALGPADTRFLQAALAWSGHYAGLTDGAWGGGSQGALDGFAEGGGDLGALLQDFEGEVERGGWAVLNLDPLTVALPLALLEEAPAGPDALEYGTPEGDLVLRVLSGSLPEAERMHDWMAGAHAGPGESYRLTDDDRWVSAVTLETGQDVYLRSSRVDGEAISVQVVSEPAQGARADLIAATLQWGRAPDLRPEPGGPIARLLAAEGPASETPVTLAEAGGNLRTAPAPRPGAGLGGMVAGAPAELPTGPPPGPFVAGLPPPALSVGGAIGAGTGFYVNARDVVTAAHVVEGCRDLRLGDGSRLSVIGLDRTLDVAVLAAERASSHWLPLLGATPRLGEPVFALGFPFAGSDITANQGLSVTGGNISALPRVADAASRVTISAPVQPGNSGGPLLGADGVIRGVVVAQLDEFYTLDHEGVLPQNMNYAVSVAQLVPFLEGAAVTNPPTAPALDMSQGVPEAVQAAVVVIGCY